MIGASTDGAFLRAREYVCRCVSMSALLHLSIRGHAGMFRVRDQMFCPVRRRDGGGAEDAEMRPARGDALVC